MGECRTTANLQRALGHCWLQDFHYQTNEHLFQCKLAVELLLLLKPLPKYHSFHKTCAAAAPARSSVHFSHCGPGLGTPKLSVQYPGTAQLWRSLFFPPSMNHQWWHKVSPTGIMVQVGAVIPWNWTVAPWCHQGKELQQPWSSSLCGESKVSQRGAARKGSHPVHALKRRKEEPLLPFIFLLLPPSTLPSGKHPCQQLNSWDWGMISHTHPPGRPLLVPQHHPPLVCFLKWLILSPFPSEAVPEASFVRLFWLAEMQGRKEKGVSCFLPFAFKVSQPDYCSSCSEEKTEFIAFVSQLAQFSCFFQCHRTPLMNTNTLSSQKDRDSKIHYLQEIGGSCYKFCAR